MVAVHPGGRKAWARKIYLNKQTKKLVASHHNPANSYVKTNSQEHSGRLVGALSAKKACGQDMGVQEGGAVGSKPSKGRTKGGKRVWTRYTSNQIRKG